MIRRDVEKSLRDMFERGYKQGYENALKENALKENKREFDGMTNGEVIQALFPDCVMSTDDEGWFITNIDGWTAFTPKWWNAPYQKGGE